MALPPDTPANVRRLLARCLQKDRKHRLRDCGDARLELDDVAPLVSAGIAGAWWRRPLVGGAAGAAVGALAMWVAAPATSRETPTGPAEARRFALVSSDQRLSDSGRLPMAVSRDGRHIVFAGGQRLMLRGPNDLAPRPIAGTELVATPAGARGNTGIAIQPILSPDGESVAYWQGGELKRVAVAGGTPSVICACPDAFGATWGDDGNILFARGPNSTGIPPGVWQVPAAGGTAERLVAVEPGNNALRPQRLPGGAHVLFTLERGENFDQANVVAVTLASGERHVLVEGAIDGRYLSSGHLVYGKDGVLHAVRFDPVSLKVTGTPTPVLSGVAQQTSAGAWGGFGFDASDEGTVVYMPAASAALRRVLVWIDRDGAEEALPTEPRAYQYPRVSSDGQRVALDLRDQQNDVWSWDLSRRTLTRVTIGRYAGGPAIWNASGSAVVFGMGVDGTFNLHTQPVSGGRPQRLMTTPNITQFADDVTPDGQWLIYWELDPTTRSDLRRLRLDGTAQAEDLIKTPFNEQNADISPDGRWIAYQSDESGRFEVYVRPFPDVNGGRWQVSSNGGTRPLWALDGRELFFLDPDRRMTAVPVQSSPALIFGRPATLFATAHLGLEGQHRNFDLSPDGRRFLMVRNLPPPSDLPTLVLVQNWLAGLGARVP